VGSLPRGVSKSKTYKQLLFKILGSPGSVGALGPDKAGQVQAGAFPGIRPVGDAHDPGVGRDGPFFIFIRFLLSLGKR
jgi:hypothetical protein